MSYIIVNHHTVQHRTIAKNQQQRKDAIVDNIQIGRELRSLSHAIHRKIDNSPTKLEIDNVTGTNGWIIGYLANHSDTDVFQRDLEREFGTTRSTVSKVIILMEKKGLVERVSVPHDARLKKLVLTPRSKALCEKMRRDFEETEEQLTQGFSNEELIMLRDYIERMKNNMQNS